MGSKPCLNCHFGWIIECSQDIQFFDPRCLQVLILRLVFTFNLAPARKVHAHNDIPSFLQRFCPVLKNGVSWCYDYGVTSHLELSDNGKYFVLKISSRVLKPEILIVASPLQFEPYAGLNQDTLQCILSEKNAKKDIRILSGFIAYFASQIADSEHIKLYAKMGIIVLLIPDCLSQTVLDRSWSTH